jgi:thioredoxin-like negative regulator of GroEL
MFASAQEWLAAGHLHQTRDLLLGSMPMTIPKSRGHGRDKVVSSVTPATLNALLNEAAVPILVSFHTPASEAMFPTHRELVELFAGLLCLVRVDLAIYPALAERFKIRVSPTLLLFKHGVLTEFIVGTLPTRFIIETLSTALGVRPKLHALGVYTARADHRQ